MDILDIRDTRDIHASGALAKLDLSSNNTTTHPRIEYWAKLSPDFIRHIASMLKTNTTLKELNISSNYINAEAARIFSQDIQDNGALAFLTMHKYKLPVKEIKTAKELDLSNKELIAIDAIVIATLIIKVRTQSIILAAFIERNFSQDNGALAILNIMGNKLGKEGLEKFKAIRFECGETVGECKPYPVPLRSSPLRKDLTARAPTQAGLARRTARASRW